MLKVQHIAKETSAFVVLHYRYMFCSAKTAFFPGWSNYVRQAFHPLLPHWPNGCSLSWKKQYSFHLQNIYVLCCFKIKKIFSSKIASQALSPRTWTWLDTCYVSWMQVVFLCKYMILIPNCVYLIFPLSLCQSGTFVASPAIIDTILFPRDPLLKRNFDTDPYCLYSPNKLAKVRLRGYSRSGCAKVTTSGTMPRWPGSSSHGALPHCKLSFRGSPGPIR